MRVDELHVTIVGLGLMGGSLAKALSGTVGSITGVDQNPATLERAIRSGVVDRAELKFSSELGDDGLLVLAIPVHQIINVLKDLPLRVASRTRVLDLGSTKRDIVAEMSALPARFSAIGGHPMCGREVSGLEAAVETLYDGKNFVLCRTKRTDAEIEKLVLDIIDSIGARPLFMSAEKHDTLVALTSHLPFVLSSLLSLAAGQRARRVPDLWKVAASGFRDTSRLASTDTEMMLEVLQTNRQAILEELSKYQEILRIVIEQLEKEDYESLGELLESARAFHRQYRESDLK